MSPIRIGQRLALDESSTDLVPNLIATPAPFCEFLGSWNRALDPDRRQFFVDPGVFFAKLPALVAERLAPGRLFREALGNRIDQLVGGEGRFFDSFVAL